VGRAESAGESFRIGYSSTGLAGLPRGPDIVSEATQIDHGRIGKVLVGLQSGHGSRVRVFANLPVDLIKVRPDERPSVDKILSAQGRIGRQKIRLATSETTSLLQKPNRNASPAEVR
jgi:hypothetical protein